MGHRTGDAVLTWGLNTLRLAPGEKANIGRGPECEVSIAEGELARVHAVVYYADGWAVADRGSAGGTFVDGQPVVAQWVTGHTEVRLGGRDDGPVVTVEVTQDRADEPAGESVDVPANVPADDAAVVTIGTAADNSHPLVGGLEVSGLDYYLADGTRLLRGIDLRVPRGTLTAVIGPSGAGKSTLATLVAGLLVPSQGTVRCDDFDVHGNPALVSSRLGLVPQESVIHSRLTLGQALTYSAQLRLSPALDAAARGAHVARVLAQLGLTGHEGTRIDRLSGGQRKRASMALELLTQPSLLVLDEPTTGLDPALDRQVMETLREVADDERAVLVITHSVAYLDLCDQVLVLSAGGRPAYCGTASGVRDHFGTDDWADIFGTLAEHPDRVYARYRESRGRVATAAVDIVRPLGVPGVPTLGPRPAARLTPGWAAQLLTLTGRQARLLVADRAHLAFLALLPVLMGVLTLLVPGSRGFTVTDATDAETATEPTNMLVLLILGALFMGTSLSIRDLVEERSIFLRERAVGLSVGAYLAAKVVVYGAVAWVSTGVMLAVVLVGNTPPAHSLVLPSGALDLYLALGLTASTSVLLGLLLSSLVRSREQVMPVLIGVVLVQLVMHGGLIPVTGRVVLDAVSLLAPARWGFAAAASGMDLRALVASTPQDALWAHDTGVWWLSVGIMVLYSLAYAVGAGVRLRGLRGR